MSGLEIASLVIGVVPIIVEILKSYSATRDRLKTFARHVQVVCDIQLRFRVAATNFRNDCQLLLKAVVDDARELSEMVEDPQHSRWHDASLELRFRAYLERDHQLCEDIVVKIRDVLRQTQSRLSELSRGLLSGTGNASAGSQQTAVSRLYQAFNVSRKENQYYRWLDDLDQWNNKLSCLRSQRYKLHKRRNFPSSCLVRKAVPRKYPDIRAASERLYEALEDSWSCSNTSHTGHQAKLSVDADTEYGNVRLDVVIACRSKSSTTNQSPPLEPPIWLHVQSLTSKSAAPEPALPTQILSNSLSNTLRTPIITASNKDSKSIVQFGKSSLKRVRFGDQDQTESSPRPQPKHTSRSKTSKDSEGTSFALFDLKATDSICCHLSRTCSSTSTCQDTCLGYLESPSVHNSFRLVFYDAGRTTAKQSNQQNRKVTLPVSGLLQRLQTLHQLTLAHKLAIATLQYHSTAWLPGDWCLQNIAYFTDTSESHIDDILKGLQSLHLSTQFPNKPLSTFTQTKQSPEDLKYIYGVRNLTLAKLGVALIEIGCQKTIGSFGFDPTSHDVISARRILSEQKSSLLMLGPRYLKIVQKCVDCDFSCGDNLNEDGLQSAVYTDVVCGSEDMIKDWKKFLGLR